MEMNAIEEDSLMSTKNNDVIAPMIVNDVIAPMIVNDVIALMIVNDVIAPMIVNDDGTRPRRVFIVVASCDS